MTTPAHSHIINMVSGSVAMADRRAAATTDAELAAIAAEIAATAAAANAMIAAAEAEILAENGGPVDGHYRMVAVRAIELAARPYFINGDRRYVAGCSFCEREHARGNRFFPSHVASTRCESGRHDHCTCDTCF